MTLLRPWGRGNSPGSSTPYPICALSENTGETCRGHAGTRVWIEQRHPFPLATSAAASQEFTSTPSLHTFWGPSVSPQDP